MPRTGALDRCSTPTRRVSSTPTLPRVSVPRCSRPTVASSSSVVSSGPAATPGDVATFEVATGAPVGEPNVGGTADSYALAISADLRFLVLYSSSGASVVDSATGADLADIPCTDVVTETTPPLAIDPVQPIVAFQAGEGAITLADWAQVGARNFASLAHSGRIAGPVVLSPAGAPVGLARPLRLLGLPLQSSPQDPWMATTSNTGAVAILSSSGIAIWDPVSGRVTRRLTGISIDCNGTGESLVPDEWAFTGSASTGHVVASCGNTVELWALSTARATPTWQQPWPGRFVTDSGVQISDDGAVVTDGTTLGVEIRDGRTGRVRASGPAASEDNAIAASLSADGHVLATMLYTGTGDPHRHDERLGAPDLGAAGRGDVRGQWGTGHRAADVGHQPGPSVGGLLAPGSQRRPTLGCHHRPVDRRLRRTPDRRNAARRCRRPGDQAGALTFTSNGSALVLKDVQNFSPASGGGEQTGASAGVVRTVTWSLQPSHLVQAACATVKRNLTRAEWDSYVASAFRTTARATCRDRPDSGSGRWELAGLPRSGDPSLIDTPTGPWCEP